MQGKTIELTYIRCDLSQNIVHSITVTVADVSREVLIIKPVAFEKGYIPFKARATRRRVLY